MRSSITTPAWKVLLTITLSIATMAKAGMRRRSFLDSELYSEVKWCATVRNICLDDWEHHKIMYSLTISYATPTCHT